MALPLGVEPRSSVPETNVLSIELQEQVYYKQLFMKYILSYALSMILFLTCF